MLNADAIEALRDLAQPRDLIATPDGGKVVALPAGYQLHKVPPLDPPLTHIKQQVVLHDRDSFIGYVNAYKSGNSRIFAEPGFLSATKTPVIKAVLDYHAATDRNLVEGAPRPEAEPMRAAHVALYSPRYSDAWTRWTTACAQPLSQVEFAELIEECREDIRQPLAAELLDIVRTFKVSKKTNYDSLVYQRDGSVKLDFSDQVDKAGSAILLPESMTLGLPVFYRGSLFAVPLFIRFKVNQGVQFSLKLDRADRFEDETFIGGGADKGLAGEIAEATGVPLHIGRV